MADWADRALELAALPWDRLPGAGTDDVTISSNTNVTALAQYTATSDPECGYLDVHDLTINAGVTLTINRWCLWIRATGAVTINGTINGNGNGASGGDRQAKRAGAGMAAARFRWLKTAAAAVMRRAAAGGGDRIPGAAARSLDSGDVLRSPLSGGGAGRHQSRQFGGDAGSTIIITARRIVIGSAGLITSTGANGSGSGSGGSGAGGVVCLFADALAIERATGYVANAGATGNDGSEGIREVYYRSASPPVIEADWHQVRRWRAARRAWTLPSSDDVLA